MNLPETNIYLAAAGHGTRMRGAMDAMGFTDIPKHLLPTGENDSTTLLGRNLRIAQASGQKAILLVNRHNNQVIQKHDDIDTDGVEVVVDACSVLGPFSFIEQARKTDKKVSASGAGDVYVEGFAWSGLLGHHQQSPFPVTFAVGKVVAGPNSAVFDIDEDGKIERFRRLSAEENVAYRNIGLYVVSLTQPILDIIQDYTSDADEFSLGRQDEVATDLIREGLAGAYLHQDAFFNINTPSDYESLLAHTDKLAQAV